MKVRDTFSRFEISSASRIYPLLLVIIFVNACKTNSLMYVVEYYVNSELRNILLFKKYILYIYICNYLNKPYVM